MYVRVIEKKSSRDRNTGSIEKRARKREREREVSLLTATSKSIQLLLREIIGKDL